MLHPPQLAGALTIGGVQGVMADAPASKGHTGGFAVQHMLKDLRLASDAAGTVRSPVPMTEKVLEIYEKVRMSSPTRGTSAACM